MITLRLDLTVQCAQCGAAMPHHITQSGSQLWIAPCLACLKRANNAGFEDGHAKGWDEAKQDQQEVVH